jgi:hypothetical protein
LIFVFFTCFCLISFAVDPGLQVYGGVLFSELVHSGGEIFKGLPLKKYSDRDANINNNKRNNNARAAPMAVANNYYAGNNGGCFSGECVVQCKEQDGMVREKQLSQVGDYFVCLSSLHCIVFFFFLSRFVLAIVCKSLMLLVMLVFLPSSAWQNFKDALICLFCPIPVWLSHPRILFECKVLSFDLAICHSL